MRNVGDGWVSRSVRLIRVRVPIPQVLTLLRYALRAALNRGQAGTPICLVLPPAKLLI